MKLRQRSKAISYTLSTAGILLSLMNVEAQAGTMGPIEQVVPGRVYVGVFGGAGASTRTDISLYGTAFFTEAEGGPLAVNAFGRSDSRHAGFVGGQIGYLWPEIINWFGSTWSLSPAVELEGYYLGKDSFTGHDLNNDTTRLPEHDFLVTYPMHAGVFLGNAILNFNPAQSIWHPYVGAGIGGAVISISNAGATQVSPPEVGVNHFNSNPHDKVSTFAGQIKAGLNFDVSKNASVFVEYRGLYVGDTDYTFGSTVYPGHAPTSSWRVNLDSQYYNMGAIGVHYII